MGTFLGISGAALELEGKEDSLRMDWGILSASAATGSPSHRSWRQLSGALAAILEDFREYMYGFLQSSGTASRCSAGWPKRGRPEELIKQEAHYPEEELTRGQVPQRGN